MLFGKLVTLRPSIDDDLPCLTTWRNDVTLQHSLMAVPKPNTRERVRAWLARRQEDEHGVFFVIADSQTNQPLGFVQAVELDLLHGRGELGIAVDTAAQGRGYAREALQLLEGYLAARLGLHKLLLSVLAENGRARRFYLREGYREIGLLREHFHAQHCRHDVVLMEKLLHSEAQAA